jgi:biotin transport system substrate-specific component
MQKSLTLSQVLWPSTPRIAAPARSLARSICLMAFFSALIGLCAHVQFRLGFTPVPITGQTFGVLLTGALLGPRLGVATLVLYMIEGQLGLPVYASAGTIASFGYIIGFVLAAGVVGFLAERGWDRKPLLTTAMMLFGSLIIYAAGVVWLAHFIGGLDRAVTLGVFPFLPGDTIKAAAAAALLPTGWALLGRHDRAA